MRAYEEEAQRRYGVRFDTLSGFAQREIRLAVGRKLTENSDEATMNDYDVARALKIARDENERLKQENYELWIENEELNLQLIERQDESRTRRSTRDPQSLASISDKSGLRPTNTRRRSELPSTRGFRDGSVDGLSSRDLSGDVPSI